NFIPHAVTGLPQLVTASGLQSGTLAVAIDASLAGRANHAFLDDIAHTAVPFGDHDGNPASAPQPLAPDADTVPGGQPALGFYDDEVVNGHFITGDGRGNENIGLTAVHHVFHSEHNRLVDHIKDVVLASNDPNFIREWLLTGANIADGIQAAEWDGQ